VEGLDEGGRVGGVRGREGDAETEGREDGEGGGEGGCGGVVRGGKDADGGVAAELDGDEKRDDRILVGDADRRVDRLWGVTIGGTGTGRARTWRTDHSSVMVEINNTIYFIYVFIYCIARKRISLANVDRDDDEHDEHDEHRADRVARS
jgi:hypothetical protein